MAIMKSLNPDQKEQKSLFERCRAIDCSDIIHKNYQGVSYISWADAWARLKENFPEAIYHVVEFPKDSQTFTPNEIVPQVPYLKTEFGIFVKVAVMMEGIEISEMLPVMDNKMNAIREPDARDINDSLKRCLVKAIALHGLGLSVYEKDDVYANAPKGDSHQKTTIETSAQTSPAKDGEFRFTFGKYKGLSFQEIPPDDLESYIAWMQKEDLKSNKGKINAPLYRTYETWKSTSQLLAPEEPPFGDDDLPF